MGAHTTSDDPTRYREEAEVKGWLKKDPVDRLEKYLLSAKILHKGEREAMETRLAEEILAKATEAEAICTQLSPDEMFRYLYQEVPQSLESPMEETLRQYALQDDSGVVHG